MLKPIVYKFLYETLVDFIYTLASLHVLSQVMIHSGLCTFHGHAIKYAQPNSDENMNKVFDLHNLELNMRQAGFLKLSTTKILLYETNMLI